MIRASYEIGSRWIERWRRNSGRGDVEYDVEGRERVGELSPLEDESVEDDDRDGVMGNEPGTLVLSSGSCGVDGGVGG